MHCGKKHGLTVDELVEVAMLCLFHKYDMKLYEEAKKTAKPQVLKHVEETLNLK